VGLLDRITARTVDRPLERRFAIDQWLSNYLIPSTFGYGGVQYGYGGTSLNQTLSGNKATEIVATLPGYAAALRGCPPAFAAQMVRALVLSQARFTFRNLPSSPRARRTFGTRDLGVLERPWTNATTGELLARMEWHAGLAGNAYVTRQPDRLRVLRPDWVALLFGSHREPDAAGHALDGTLLGYVYCNEGFNSGNRPETLLPQDVAHWSPIPDPECAGVGMSWITPAVRDIQGDRLATEHKIRFFENGATPNLVVKGVTAATRDQFEEIVDAMEEKHAGVANAYRTLYLAAGADATVVGSDLSQIDFKSTQGLGETRLSVLSRVPAALLGISEGLSGSSLNAGNFSAARRMFADTWVYPTLQDLCGATSTLVTVPADAELWFDVADMPILREDAKDAAEIAQIQMATIVSGVNGGFEAESVKAAVIGQNMSLLKHTGMVSVQLQQPGAEQPAGPEMALEPAEEADRAAGVDTHPGGEQLKHYWLHGEGAAKWSTWTELYHHLVKYLSPAMAKRTAAEWFHLRYGFWPGADLNLVKHGKPPRGHVVGPG
jgi:phage portal protein BeeE